MYRHGSLPRMELLYDGMAAHMDHLALRGSPVRRGARRQRRDPKKIETIYLYFQKAVNPLGLTAFPALSPSL